jgi:hypothetical protein
MAICKFTSIKNQGIKEVYSGFALAAGAFLIVYSSQNTYASQEKNAITTALALAAVKSLAEINHQKEIWIITSVTYAAAWAWAAATGPQSLWVPAFYAVVVHAGLLPALATGAYI